MTVETEAAKWTVHVRVDKYIGEDADERALAGLEADEVVEADGNLLTTAGLGRLMSLLTAGGGQAYDSTHTRIGVGNGTTAANVADTDLAASAGSGNRQFETMAATYPQVSGGVFTARSVFSTGEANFHWQEWCIDNGTASGTTVTAVMLNRKVTDLGTKTSAAAWTFTITITIA